MNYGMPMTYAAPAGTMYGAGPSTSAPMYAQAAMTYAAPQSTVSYGAAPATSFDMLDRDGDGVITRAEFAGAVQGMPQVMTTAAPPMTMTYGAPQPQMQMTYGAPVTYAAPQPQMQMTYAAPPQPQMRTHMVPNLLAAGHLVYEQAVGREQLIQSGHLIPNPEAEDNLMRQGMSIPGALQGPHMIAAAHIPHPHPAAAAVNHGIHAQPPPQHTHTVHHAGGHGGHPVQEHGAPHQPVHDHGPPPPQPVHTTESTGKEASAGARALAVSILQANELHHLNRFGGDNMWVECKVIHKGAGYFSHVPKCTTMYADKKLSPDPLNPVWNEQHQIDGYYPGDQLQFTVFDHGFLGSKTEGVCHLDSENFFPNGWEGEINLEHDNASISVRIEPLGVLQGH